MTTLDKNSEAGPASYLVLGGYGGVGRATCTLLLEQGARVAVLGRDSSRLEQLHDELGVACYRGDATSFEDVATHARQAHDHFGRLDGIANCVGSLLLKPAHLTSASEWETTLATNLTSAMATLRAAAEVMGSAGGAVVLVASAAARIGIANHEAIAAAKAGVIGLTLSGAATYASRGLRVNCIAPGLVRTPLTERLTSNPDTMKASASMHALGRLGEPEDIAAMIAWLLGPAAGWMTGQVIGVDGGLASVVSRRTAR